MFFENVKHRSNWVRDLCIDSTCRQWFDNNYPKYNNKGYIIRLFVVFVEEVPSKEAITKIGELICLRINVDPNNNTTISLNKESYFWLEDAVWADIIGSEAAYKALLKETPQKPCLGYFESNKDVIYSYFHAKTLSTELARMLFAPTDELHPSCLEKVRGNQ